MWLGGTWFDGGAILWKSDVYICIISEELCKSGDSHGVDWTLCTEYTPRYYVDMIYIAIVGK